MYNEDSGCRFGWPVRSAVSYFRRLQTCGHGCFAADRRSTITAGFHNIFYMCRFDAVFGEDLSDLKRWIWPGTDGRQRYLVPRLLLVGRCIPPVQCSWTTWQTSHKEPIVRFHLGRFAIMCVARYFTLKSLLPPSGAIYVTTIIQPRLFHNCKRYSNQKS